MNFESKPGRQAVWAFWAAVALLGSAWALRPIWDMDLWWHLALGRWISTFGFPELDPLAVGREETPWRTFQGGYEWFFYHIEQWTGLQGVRVLHAGAVGLGLGLFGWISEKASRSRALAMAAVFALLFLYEDRIRVRPHVFQFLFTMWMLACLSRPAFQWRRKDLFHLLPLLSIWSMFHGPGSLWGLLFIGCGSLARWRSRIGWEVLGLSTIWVAIMPGVVPGLMSAFSVHTRPGIQKRFVPEHGPLWSFLQESMPRYGILFALVLLAAGLGLYGFFRAWRNKRVPVALALGVLPLTVFSLTMARFSWFAAGPLLLLLHETRGLTKRTASLILLMTGLLWSWDATVYVWPRYASLPESPWHTNIQPGYPHDFPVHATRFLQKAGIQANIYNEVGWGGYLLYGLGPETRTLYDSRIAFTDWAADMLIQDDQAKAHWAAAQRSSGASRNHHLEAFQNTRRDLAAQARKRGMDLIVRRAPFFAPGADPMATSDWTLLYRDGTAEIWAANDDALSARIDRIRKAWEGWEVQSGRN